MTKKAVIIDDHPLFGKSLQPIFSRLGYSQVFLHTSGKAALECIDRERPSLVATDIQLEGMTGFDVIKACSHLIGETAFIVISMHDQPSFPKRALKLGATGYMVKSDDEKDICDCICQVENGQIYISKTIRNKYPDFLLDNSSAVIETDIHDLSVLTYQEKRILQLLHQGKTSKEIGRELQISYRTVQNHRSHICEKLSLRGPNVLLKFAIDHADVLFDGES